jgi:hypothetical protein
MIPDTGGVCNMKKNHIRDYATEAFRFYARTGSSAKHKQKIWDEAIAAQRKRDGSGTGGSPTEAAITYAEARVADAQAELADLEAAEKTLIILENSYSGYDMVKALRMVYMADPDKDIERGDIQERTHRAELIIPASERSIYGWLSKARYIFTQERGLRV